MKMYNALVEVKDKRKVTPARADQLLEDLATYHVAVSTSPRGWLELRVSLPAESLAQACATAAAVVGQATGAEPIACEVMTEAEFEVREGWMPMPELVTVTQAAELLGGVSRQAVLDRIDRGTLQAEKVGRDYLIPRSALEGEARRRRQVREAEATGQG